MNENSNAQQVDPFQRLQAELNDAHLVIGQQQVALMRFQQAVNTMRAHIDELENRIIELETTEVG